MINFNNDPNEISRAEYYDKYRKPSIEEFVNEFEYEYAQVIFRSFTNIGESYSNQYVWKYAKVGSASGCYRKEILQEMLDKNEIRVKKLVSVEETNLNYLDKLREQVLQAHKTKKVKEVPRVYIRTKYNTIKEMIRTKNPNKNKIVCVLGIDYINETTPSGLKYTYKLPRYLAEKLIKKESEISFSDWNIVPMHYWKAHLREKRLERKKLAKKNSLAELKKYNFKKGNRKQRRKEYNKYGQPGDRHVHLQLVAVKEKNEKIAYKGGKNILLSSKGIPYGKPKETKVVLPKFMNIPIEEMYNKNVTIEPRIRKTITGRDLIVLTTKLHYYTPVEYTTITQHLYPSYLRKLYKKRKEQFVKLQEELQKMQEENKNKNKEKKVNKIKKQPTKVVKSKQKKGD